MLEIKFNGLYKILYIAYIVKSLYILVLKKNQLLKYVYGDSEIYYQMFSIRCSHLMRTLHY